MADFKALLGEGSIARQFLMWSVFAQVAQVIMGPSMQALAQTLNEFDPNVPLSPSLLADSVARGKIDLGYGQSHAVKSGIAQEPFDHMIAAVRHAPDASFLLEAVRRGLIPADGQGVGAVSLEQGLIDGAMSPEWIALLKHFVTQPPTAQEALNAYLEGQIDRGTLETRYAQAGGDPTWLQHAIDANGLAPSPVELGTMANRGIIPWEGDGPGVVSFHQGFLEGPWRNKWAEPMRKLAEYRPPPRTITALIHEGVITDARALVLFRQAGLSQELAADYVAAAHVSKTAVDHELTKSEIIRLYKDKLITAAQAHAALLKLHYSEVAAKYLLELADVHKVVATNATAVTRVRTLYTGHKITQQAAHDALVHLGVPAPHIAELLTEWNLLAALSVKALTEAQIVNASGFGIMTESEAMTELQHLGYTAYDAWVLLSIHNKKPLPNKPSQGPNPIGVNP